MKLVFPPPRYEKFVVSLINALKRVNAIIDTFPTMIDDWGHDFVERTLMLHKVLVDEISSYTVDKVLNYDG